MNFAPLLSDKIQAKNKCLGRLNVKVNACDGSFSWVVTTLMQGLIKLGQGEAISSGPEPEPAGAPSRLYIRLCRTINNDQIFCFLISKFVYSTTECVISSFISTVFSSHHLPCENPLFWSPTPYNHWLEEVLWKSILLNSCTKRKIHWANKNVHIYGFSCTGARS